MVTEAKKWPVVTSSAIQITFKLEQISIKSASCTIQTLGIDAYHPQCGDKRGCLLIQFPASMKNHQADQLEHLLQVVEMNNTDNPWKVAIEFRDNSWYTEDINNLMNQYGATFVIHDKPGAPPGNLELKSKIKYLRFHGPRGDYRGSYDEAFLHEYATYIHEWREAGNSVFVYFNNTNGDAYNNLRQLLREVDEKS